MISGGRSGLAWQIAVALLICTGCLLEVCSPSAAQKAPHAAGARPVCTGKTSKNLMAVVIA
jgi:hypothetical protein